MTAHPQSRPLPGSPPPAPMAPTPAVPPMMARPTTAPPITAPPPMVAPALPSGSTQPVAGGATTRAQGPTRLAVTVLAISALVAVAGVSFSLGRLSVEGGSSSTPTSGAPFAAAGLPARGDALATGTVAGGVDVPSATEATTDEAAASDASALTGSLGDPAAAPASGGDSTVSATGLSDGEVVSTLDGEPPQGGDLAQRPVGDGPPPGAGRGGVEGTVTEVSDSTLVVTLTDGSTQTVAVDGTTAWVVQQPIDPGDIAAGDTVSIQLPFGSFGSADATTMVATQVTVTHAAP